MHQWCNPAFGYNKMLLKDTIVGLEHTGNSEAKQKARRIRFIRSVVAPSNAAHGSSWAAPAYAGLSVAAPSNAAPFYSCP